MTQHSENDGPAPNTSSGVMLITNEDQQPGGAAAFDYAAALAARFGVDVTLYDRSEETWGDSQHPDGPLRVDDARLGDRVRLKDQLQWFEDRSIVAQGWVATLPSISAALTALAQIKADVVLVPTSVDRNLFERALEGSSLAESLAEQIERNPEIDASVWQVDDDGSVASVGRAA